MIADALAIVPPFNIPPGSAIAVFDPSIWERQFLVLLLDGKGFAARTPGFSMSLSDKLTNVVSPSGFDCIFSKRSYFDSGTIASSATDPKSFVLAKAGERFAAVAGLEGRNEADNDTATKRQFVWTGNQGVNIWMLSRASAYPLRLAVIPAVPSEKVNTVLARVEVDGKLMSTFDVSQPTNIEVKLHRDSVDKFSRIRIVGTKGGGGQEPSGPAPMDLGLRVEVAGVHLDDLPN